MIVRLHDFKTPHESDVTIEVPALSVAPLVSAFPGVRLFDAVTRHEVARCRGDVYSAQRWQLIEDGIPHGHHFNYCDVEA